MTDTTFQTLIDERDEREWPDSTHRRQTLVSGALADRIRAKTGMAGEVVIHEDGSEDGYSEMTVEWVYEVVVKVGDTTAWSTSSYADAVMEVNERSRYGTFADLMRWLNDD